MALVCDYVTSAANLRLANNIATHPQQPNLGNTNYTYDAVGQLTSELESDENRQLHICWTPYGKVDTVYNMDAAGTLLYYHTYLYDAMGNQVRDIKYDPTNTAVDTRYSIYDGHNTKLAEYTKLLPITGISAMRIQERYLYGSERLGMYAGQNNVITTGGIKLIAGPSNTKHFEMHDHLGNVRAMLYGAPPVIYAGTSTVQPESYYNYYAFGSPHPLRSFDVGVTSKFGFNGQERRDDYKGTGNHNHALYWEYDTRTGRRWNMDPKPTIGISDYAVMGNSPIWHNDPMGDSIRAFVKEMVNGVASTVQLTYRFTEKLGYGFFRNDGTMYDGNDNFIKSLSESIGRISLGSEGNKLVRCLMDDKRSFNILETKFENWTEGKGAFIRWNPKSVIGGFNQDGNRNTKSWLSLAHEMGHEFSIFKGTSNQSLWSAPDVTFDEINASHIENKIRAENGISLRTHYAVMDNGNGTFSPDPTTQLIRTGLRQSLYYDINESVHYKGIKKGVIPYEYQNK